MSAAATIVVGSCGNKWAAYGFCDPYCSMDTDKQDCGEIERTSMSEVESPLDELLHVGRTAAPMIVFTAATSVIYHLNRRHQHQDWFLLGGIVLGAIIGLGILRDLPGMILGVLPWTVLGSLLLSTMCHSRGLESGSENEL